jgi:hypothetical protein
MSNPASNPETVPRSDTPHQPDAAHMAELGHAQEMTMPHSRTLFRRFGVPTSLIGLLVMTAGVGYSIYKGEQHSPTTVVQPPPPAPAPVPVKVTKGGQPATDGFTIRIEHGPTFPLDANGEAMIDAQYRSARYEIKDKTGAVLKRGIVPDSGRLDADLA